MLFSGRAVDAAPFLSAVFSSSPSSSSSVAQFSQYDNPADFIIDVLCDGTVNNHGGKYTAAEEDLEGEGEVPSAQQEVHAANAGDRSRGDIDIEMIELSATPAAEAVRCKETSTPTAILSARFLESPQHQQLLAAQLELAEGLLVSTRAQVLRSRQHRRSQRQMPPRAAGMWSSAQLQLPQSLLRDNEGGSEGDGVDDVDPLMLAFEEGQLEQEDRSQHEPQEAAPPAAFEAMPSVLGSEFHYSSKALQYERKGFVTPPMTQVWVLFSRRIKVK